MDNQSIVIVVSPSSTYGRPSATMTQGNVRAVYVGDADSGTEFEVCTARFQLTYLKSRGSQNREAKKAARAIHNSDVIVIAYHAETHKVAGTVLNIQIIHCRRLPQLCTYNTHVCISSWLAS